LRLQVGIFFLLITFLAIVMHYGDDRIWRAGLPGREVLLAGYFGVLAMNVVTGWQGYSFFKKDVIASYRPLFAACAMAYLLLSVAAVLVDWQYNQINKHYLNRRRSEAYRVSRPDAIADLGRLGPAVASQIGPDLRSPPPFPCSLCCGSLPIPGTENGANCPAMPISPTSPVAG
jgi:hypothetical protein